MKDISGTLQRPLICGFRYLWITSLKEYTGIKETWSNSDNKKALL
jgi:hypothetical protein